MIPYSLSSIPEWQRQVASEVNPILQGYPFLQLDAAPTSVDPGFTYYDTALNKVRTWDGTIWNNHF